MSTGTDDELWSAIADPSRRRVLDLLVQGGDATASALAQKVPFSRQAVIKHLVVLEHAGLVTRQRATGARSASTSNPIASTRPRTP